MPTREFDILIEQYLTGELTPERQDELLKAIVSSQYRAELEHIMQRQYEANAFTDVEDIVLKERIFDAILSSKKQSALTVSNTDSLKAPAHRVHFLKTAWFRYAAAIILCIGLGTYLWIRTNENTKLVQDSRPAPTKYDVAPGGNKAVLTLSDGKNIELDSSGKLIYRADGLLSPFEKGGRRYLPGDLTAGGFNTMSTPRGGQYQLTLSDGTKVWLNAASSITYPTIFNGSTREVAISGEAYFEIAPNKSKPFHVKTFKDEILVLGTEFNINAYSDESIIKTSLVTGSVKIKDKILQSGQAYINGKVIETNIGQDIAWKNGYFSFNNSSIESVMRQLSRWYDLDVKYAEGLPAATYSGKIGRSLTLQQVLGLLTKTKFDYKINGKTITILPKK